MSSHEIIAPVHQVVFRDTMIDHVTTAVVFDKEQKHTGRYIRLLLYLLLVYVKSRMLVRHAMAFLGTLRMEAIC